MIGRVRSVEDPIGACEEGYMRCDLSRRMRDDRHRAARIFSGDSSIAGGCIAKSPRLQTAPRIAWMGHHNALSRVNIVRTGVSAFALFESHIILRDELRNV